jgi:hypothetical protein
MAFNLSTPTAALAFEMALRNQKAIDSSAGADAEARQFVTKALAPGNDPLSLYEDIYRQYMDPAEAQRRAQAQAFNDYLIGLPELLAKASTEGRSTGGGGGGTESAMASATNTGYISPQERLRSMLNSLVPAQQQPSRTPTVTRQQRTAITRSGMGSGRIMAKTTAPTETSRR